MFFAVIMFNVGCSASVEKKIGLEDCLQNDL